MSLRSMRGPYSNASWFEFVRVRNLRETDAMTKLLEQALRQVEQLSENDQDAAGAALIDYLAHRDDTRLSDAQLAEVRHRRADPDRRLVSHAEGKGTARPPSRMKLIFDDRAIGDLEGIYHWDRAR